MSPTLSSEHLKMLLKESGISSELIAQRGYETAATKARLKDLGFAASQQRTPAMVLPLHDVTGTLAGYQIRPDNPRWKDNKPIKYETPKGAKMRLDIPPTVRQHLGKPAVPLFITEGIKKGDCLASRSTDAEPLCVVALLGVWNWRGTNQYGGKALLPDWESVALNGRCTYIVFDGDIVTKKEVRAALERLALILEQRGARVRCIYLPQTLNDQKCGIDDFLVSGNTLADALALAATVRQAPAVKKVSIKPQIILSHEITKAVDKGIASIMALPGDPQVMQRAGKLVMVTSQGKSPKGITRPPESPAIVTLSAARLDELAAQGADWVSPSGAKDGEENSKQVHPPNWFAPTVFGRPGWDFPLLEGITECPTLRPDGTILETPGYDADTGLFYIRNGVTYPPLPPKPTLDDAQRALQRLEDVFTDFRFKDACHKSAAIVAVLSLVARYAIDGSVPLFGVSAPVRGSGKSLLVNIIATIATGRPSPTWSPTDNEDEDRKRLISIALAGERLVNIDNLTRPLGSPALDMALTSRLIKDRLMGTQQLIEAPFHTVCFATGNNLQFAGDMARRVVPIVLDPEMERPEERDDFAHPDILAWVRQQRAALVTAALTIARAYILAGSPKQPIPQYGSFEAWSALVRGALAWCGAADPNEGRENVEAESDPAFDELSTMLSLWHKHLGESEITAKALVDRIKNSVESKLPGWDELQEALITLDRKNNGRGLTTGRIGYALRSYKGRIVKNLRLIASDGKGEDGKTWKVKKTTHNPDDTDHNDDISNPYAQENKNQHTHNSFYNSNSSRATESSVSSVSSGYDDYDEGVIS